MYFKGTEQQGFSEAHWYYAYRLRVQRLDDVQIAFIVTVPKSTILT